MKQSVTLESVFSTLPNPKPFVAGIRRAPRRIAKLSQDDERLAIKNALRYIPERFHQVLISEFYQELRDHGRIYGYRFRPEGCLKAGSIQDYQGQCLEGRAFQLMIHNNLDFDTALYPYELVTYGETGQVCQNWMQYQLIMAYLKQLNHDTTLVIQSGHPLGLFRSHDEAPRVIITNGLMVGMYDNPEEFCRAAAIGVANYGQMTAGGWMYIGPQGIVHGTYNTLAIAGRLKLGIPADGTLKGRLFISSGLGGMSGAQPKAAEIAGAVTIIAEVDPSRVQTRFEQGWVRVRTRSTKEAFSLAQKAKLEGRPLSIAYEGNIIDLLEFAALEKITIDLLSDQTSCHAPYEGGYCPHGISFEERTRLLATDRSKFKALVDDSLRHHFHLIQTLSNRGTYFFDYGNAFLKAVYDAGETSVARGGDERNGFVFPSYIEDILGPELFDYGYGPFRWVCLSGSEADLANTDAAAAEVIMSLRPQMRYQDRDNYQWVRDACKNQLVVGSKARILYQDAKGRTAIALRFNQMVREGLIGPIMLGRDHHDTGGTDSPFRETANINDGSRIMAEMATQCFAGNAARGMSLVALHNGGGVGIGKSINGGFGMLLDGSDRADRILKRAISWDVMSGVARRAWAGNPHAVEVVHEYNQEFTGEAIGLPFLVKDEVLNSVF